MMSVTSSALTIMFLFWSISLIAKEILKVKEIVKVSEGIKIFNLFLQVNNIHIHR